MLGCCDGGGTGGQGPCAGFLWGDDDFEITISGTNPATADHIYLPNTYYWYSFTVTDDNSGLNRPPCYNQILLDAPCIDLSPSDPDCAPWSAVIERFAYTGGSEVQIDGSSWNVLTYGGPDCVSCPGSIPAIPPAGAGFNGPFRMRLRHGSQPPQPFYNTITFRFRSLVPAAP